MPLQRYFAVSNLRCAQPFMCLVIGNYVLHYVSICFTVLSPIYTAHSTARFCKWQSAEIEHVSNRVDCCELSAHCPQLSVWLRIYPYILHGCGHLRSLDRHMSACDRDVVRYNVVTQWLASRPVARGCEFIAFLCFSCLVRRDSLHS